MRSGNPITWAFECHASLKEKPGKVLKPTYFYKSGCNRRWERFGYTYDDALSLIDYLNSRYQP